MTTATTAAVRDVIRDLEADYADYWGIDIDHVRTVIDDVDDSTDVIVRLDSYEHPGCETCTVRIAEDGTTVEGATDDE